MTDEAHPGRWPVKFYERVEQDIIAMRQGQKWMSGSVDYTEIADTRDYILKLEAERRDLRLKYNTEYVLNHDNPMCNAMLSKQLEAVKAREVRLVDFCICKHGHEMSRFPFPYKYSGLEEGDAESIKELIAEFEKEEK